MRGDRRVSPSVLRPILNEIVPVFCGTEALYCGVCRGAKRRNGRRSRSLLHGQQGIHIGFEEASGTDTARQANPPEFAFLSEAINNAHAAREAASGFFATNHTRRGIGQ